MAEGRSMNNTGEQTECGGGGGGGRAANGTSPESVSNAGDGTTTLRFLVTNTAAGSVIGKGGATISEFQVQSGARIQLSRNHEYFPGTSDRVAVLTGSRTDVLAAFRLIITKIIKDFINPDEHSSSRLQTTTLTPTTTTTTTTTPSSESQDESKSTQVKLLVPKGVCGAIIGKGGSNIKKFVEESQASIKLSAQDQLLPGVTDRIVTVGGNAEQIIKAVTLILTKLTEESAYSETASTPLVYSGLQTRRPSPVAAMQAVAYGTPSVLSARGMMGPVIALQSPYHMLPVVEVGTLTTSVTVGIPDEHIGLILGRAGKTLYEIQQTSGAKIKVSDRGDFVTGTEYRKVTIIGSGEAIQAAQYLLTQKVQQSMAAASEYERDNNNNNNSNNSNNSNNTKPVSQQQHQQQQQQIHQQDQPRLQQQQQQDQ